MDIRIEKLIQQYTLHYQENFKLSPLQSKIFAYVLIYGRKNDITFEQVIDYTKACKSSVSTSLNFLIDQKRIVYNNKPNDRKKYYKINKLSNTLEHAQKTISQELLLIEDMLAYFNETAQTLDDNKQVNNIKLFKEHLQQISLTINNTLNKIQ
jgi:DNA-binding transcriptional regulator GbsR (MarR family)